MVYQNKLVAVIKHNGKILREKDDNVVYLPFLAEYEIFIKNLNSVEAVISISIDGKDILDNQNLVIRANSNCSLEGFLKNNKVSNKFKFIQKTDQIVNYRGDHIDDGIIRIEYRFAKQFYSSVSNTIIEHHHIYNFHPPGCRCRDCNPLWIISPPYYYGTTSIGNSGTFSSSGMTQGPLSINAANGILNHSQGNTPVSANLSNCCNTSINPAFMPEINSDEGITVKGSESDQKFDSAWTPQLEDNSQVVIIRLRGYKGETKVEKPVLVKTKLICSTCGRKSKSNIKYCPECGTFLS